MKGKIQNTRRQDYPCFFYFEYFRRIFGNTFFDHSHIGIRRFRDNAPACDKEDESQANP
ncbi:hypothetical protein SDC9_175612 [bioreactor metagenome]|uniref:Uncharacterized protein n=1 Tax=bioreactor metagenome TaxID=1076179 RepID=A0A645GWZ7_9ZZZZ